MTYPPPQDPYQGAQPVQQVPPVPQKSGASKVVIIILAIVLLVCLGCAGVGAYFFIWAKDKAQEVVDNYESAFPTPRDGGAVPGGATHTVRYEVTGSGTARLVWAEVTVGQGNGDFTLPWTKEFTLTVPNFGSQIIAVPKDKSTVLDTCKIFIDGVEKKTAKFSASTLSCSFVYVSK